MWLTAPTVHGKIQKASIDFIAFPQADCEIHHKKVDF
jgi:hypothetical protein